MELANVISAVLFYQAEPLTIKRLSALLKRGEGEIRDALLPLEEKLAGVGLCLLQNGDEVTIGTAPEASALIEAITKEELSKDLSKSALETLSIVLYKGPLTRSEVDYIRGVNSTFILRNLLIRGLVEKVENPADQRSFLYKPTFQLLEYMGVGKREELPSYHDAILELGKFAEGKHLEDANVSDKEASAVADTSSEGAGVSQVAHAVFEDLEHEQLMEDLEADIIEEDAAGGGFDDEQLHRHTDSDRNTAETP